jgi:methionyl-tRNA formyltransferase
MLRVLLLTTNEYAYQISKLLTDVEHKIITTPDYPDEDLSSEYDVALSYCYPKLIKEPFLTGIRLGNINFHPAPLPAYRGFAVYNFCILNDECSWGVTAHYMDEGFDTGDIIYKHEFPIQVSKFTAMSLKNLTHIHLKQLFHKVVSDLKNNRKLPRTEQGSGVYYSREMMEKYRKINLYDSSEIIHRKVRAFWNPPHSGAFLKIGKIEYTLTTSEILRGDCDG